MFVRKKTGHNGRSGNAYWTLDLAKISEKRDGCASLKLNNGKSVADCVAGMSQTDRQGIFNIVIVYRSVFTVRCLLFSVYCLMFTVWCSLFSLFTVSWFVWLSCFIS